MPDSLALLTLLAALRDRRIPLTRDDVQWAFDSVKTHDEAVGWVQEYLQPNTLLTSEELQLYQTLRPNGPSLRDLKDPSETEPIHDHELQAAIDALEASTAAIDQQAKALEVQKDALLALKAQHVEPDSALQRRHDERHRKTAQEKAQLDFAVEGLSDAITERVTAAQKQTKATATTLVATANDRLASDDRMLAALAKLAPKLEASGSEQKNAAVVDGWCVSLVALRAAEVQTHVDAVFWESLTGFSPADAPERPEEEALAEKDALKEELETLHAEISSVAQMGIEQEHRQPILLLREQSQTQQKRLQSRWLDYILSTLEHLTLRLSHLSTHAHDTHAHQFALQESAALFSTLRPLPPPPRPTSSRGGLGPSAQQPPAHLTPATTHLLRRLDLDLSSILHPAPRPLTRAAASRALATGSQDRAARLRDHLAAAQGATTQAVAGAVAAGGAEVAALLRALYGASRFGEVRLCGKEVEGRLEALERGIGNVSACLGPLGALMQVVRDERGVRFVRGWGGDDEGEEEL
ncbi:uncharacterized protein K452DRAFT_272293 [Aplosporella prunicola CBS 121167]|uniref:HAUS augmin-like complex subunit 3 N-terminal domain-containing protein n=1 Tax=Aplosporella prunicola CBS 121167 TaxID=1176127 RepID=A0A6A6BDH2_9PEZI|nr:uncharacterized protein K452DRAFT_272293 [Aplosporella prunicola CBS 121167]KAF2141423.1 hypothetical protein K452DRAFT_272293 [Aplosporella prunicola CBS 121167]